MKRIIAILALAALAGCAYEPMPAYVYVTPAVVYVPPPAVYLPPPVYYGPVYRFGWGGGYGRRWH